MAGFMSDIVTVTMNPTIDVSTAVDRVVPTRKLRCHGMRRDPGGGGINVARVVRRLGGDVAALYPIGGMVGQLLRRLVDAEDFESIAIPVAEETRENFTATEDATGHQYRFVLPGPHLSEAEWRHCLDALKSLPARPGFVVLSGSLPPGPPDDFYVRAAQIAKDHGARIVLDTSGPALSVTLEAGVDLIKPNLRELQDLTGLTAVDRASMLAACRELIAKGRTKAVALTLGGEGAILVTADGAWRASALPIKVVSTVGAGDSFLGGMVWALSAGRTMPEAFRCGVAAGSAAVLTPGTDLCHREDVERLIGEVRVEKI
jgi:6-phosphofructokinase 2